METVSARSSSSSLQRLRQLRQALRRVKVHAAVQEARKLAATDVFTAYLLASHVWHTPALPKLDMLSAIWLGLPAIALIVHQPLRRKVQTF